MDDYCRVSLVGPDISQESVVLWIADVSVSFLSIYACYCDNCGVVFGWHDGNVITLPESIAGLSLSFAEIFT